MGVLVGREMAGNVVGGDKRGVGGRNIRVTAGRLNSMDIGSHSNRLTMVGVTASDSCDDYP